MRYLVFENDATYVLTDDIIEINKKGNVTTIFMDDIEEIVFNGSYFIFQKNYRHKQFPWSDFYFLEIGLKNGEWIAITSILHKDILEILRNQYLSLYYKANRIFFPIMTMY